MFDLLRPNMEISLVERQKFTNEDLDVSYPRQRNVGTSCKVKTAQQGCQTSHSNSDKATQTNESVTLMAVPVPLCLPLPVHLYTAPVITPVPVPLPIPVPVFLPTAKGTADNIMKHIDEIRNEYPSNQYEAEIIFMAKMLDESEKAGDVDSSKNVVNSDENEGTYSVVSEGNGLSNVEVGEVMKDSCKEAVCIDETSSTQPQNSRRASQVTAKGASRKTSRATRSVSRNLSLENCSQSSNDSSKLEDNVKVPDSNATHVWGLQAWLQWVASKSQGMKNSKTRDSKIKTNILDLSLQELNIYLGKFVREIKKPNGDEYAPDTIFYFCLGIQNYLFENGRNVNIFTDPIFNSFTTCFDEISKKFLSLHTDSKFIVTRIQENYLWENKQLGAHSPRVLLNTLIYFNMKHFGFVNVTDHKNLSFKYFVTNRANTGSSKSSKRICRRNKLMLKYFSAGDSSKKGKMLEVYENRKDPNKCPLNLFEFYLTKCPEKAKLDGNLFYLEPERSCLGESPIWFSTQAMKVEDLAKSINRFRMVKEVYAAGDK